MEEVDQPSASPNNTTTILLALQSHILSLPQAFKLTLHQVHLMVYLPFASNSDTLYPAAVNTHPAT